MQIKSMNIILKSILLTVILSTIACHKKTETKEVTPAQLELNWTLSIDQANSQELQTSIPPDMARQFEQIGAYRASSQITYTNQKTEVEFKLVFINEIRVEDIHELLPKLKSTFKEKTFKATFHGRGEKHIIRENYGLFGYTETVKTYPPITATGTMQAKESGSQ